MWMLFAWNDPEESRKYKSPKTYLPPNVRFSALLPARHEEKVIADTIKAVSEIDYPEDFKEITVLCREDDTETIKEVNKTIESLGKNNIRLLVFNDLPINKPHGLNIGLRNTSRQVINIDTLSDKGSNYIYNSNQVITIFDAEDQPHRDIYNVVNTLMTSEPVDVVQSGVQLMNFRSKWFSSINVLEYFFWFKSGLPFYTKIGHVTPLGGNTVFVKREYLDMIGGWDEDCLTEDADIGIRLVNKGARVRVVYDEQHVTREETPDSVEEFIKQRTRWNQGFLQILMKGDWAHLPQMKQKFMALYTLIAPFVQMIFLLYIPIGTWIALSYKLPMIVSMLSFVPTFLFLLQITFYLVGIYEFTQVYGIKYSIKDSLNILVAFFPYQIMLAIASVRAVQRLISGQLVWEKTTHNNAHRSVLAGVPAYVE